MKYWINYWLSQIPNRKQKDPYFVYCILSKAYRCFSVVVDCLLFVCFSFAFSQKYVVISVALSNISWFAFNCYVHRHIPCIGRIAYCTCNMQKWSQGGDVIRIVISISTNYRSSVPSISKQSPCCQQNVMQPTALSYLCLTVKLLLLTKGLPHWG